MGIAIVLQVLLLIWVARFPILSRARMTNKSWLIVVVMLKHAAEKKLKLLLKFFFASGNNFIRWKQTEFIR